MSSYKTPGVYIEEINSLPPAIAPVSTAIPVFIGKNVHKTSSVTGKPYRVTSLLEYTAIFDVPQETFEYDVTYDLIDGKRVRNLKIIPSKEPALTGVNKMKSLMYYSMQMYFANGGGPCYVLSLGNVDAASVDYVAAFATLKTLDEPTLIVCTDLALEDVATASGIQNQMLEHCQLMQDRFAILDVMNAVPNGVFDQTGVDSGFRSSVGTTPEQSMYGAAYFPYLLSSLRYAYSEDGSNAVKIKSIVISNYETVSGVVTAATPATTTDAVAKNLGSNGIKKDKNFIYSVVKERLLKTFVVIPPSSSIAGVYAITDRTRGVWKAPANVGLTMVQKPMVNITQDFNDNLNSPDGGKAVNAIRKFTGRGNLVWGARTLNANDLNWRFVSVRREVTWIEESIQKALQSMVFEPNTANTWVKAKAMVENFLTLVWRQGGLAGAKAEDAFQVNIGLNSTMSPEDIAMGIMILEVTLVPPRPAEVIVLRVSQKLQVS